LLIDYELLSLNKFREKDNFTFYITGYNSL
jgi:hypothetical protein